MNLLDNLVVRDQEGFNYSYKIRKPIGVLDHIIVWCKSELVDDWRWQLTDMSLIAGFEYIFYFNSDRDCLSFIMKWS